MEIEDRNYSVKAAREKLGIGHTKFYSEIKRGALIAHKIGRKTVIKASAINAYLRSLPKMGSAA
jgi:excisionase family DNA binding protein